MDTNPTAQLLDLAARAQHLNEPAALQDLLAEGHRAWCSGIAEVRTDIEQETASMPDAQVTQRCTAAGVVWEAGMTRGEAVAELVFAVWDSVPAAIAYTALAERAARFGVCLVREEIQ
ncbi:hypothetical protein [Streptomyces sp. NBC_00140]|uniref:hypothetical protein n=1 Tax=Streptomyces sp. NBC_00140 TaxID=2975664 RepID=UPI0022542E26|nr:hypothetical protein [Streptomyces sp. NBC_00140]MCX5336859.1 hypothetical protein [Streptomyces sp. NBC_00140]